MADNTTSVKMEFDVPATMRDGVVLRANVFRPEGEGSYPVVLTRTPYGKEFATVSPFLDAVRMARAGYIVVIQDTRSRFNSEGPEWTPFANEAEDGYDSVEWAATLPGSNGNVGMYGASYFGFTQWAAAGQNPPHLKAIIPSITWSNYREGTGWRGGALELGTLGGWYLSTAFDVLLKRYKGAPLAEKGKAIASLVYEINRLRTEGYYSLPLKDFEPLRKLGLAEQQIGDILNKPFDPEFSKPLSPREWHAQVKVPSLNIGGWYDIFTKGTLENFRAMRNEGSTPEVRQSKLLMGPWSHVNYTNTVGEQDFGFGANMAFINVQTDLTGLAQRWFDYWLKGIDTGITREAPIKIFVMGENVWRDEQEWPLARTQYTPFYLHSNGKANTLNGDGLLSTEKPGQEATDHYTYDPQNPVLTAGGNTLMNALFTPGVKDQRRTEERQDVLSYTSEPLANDTEVTGPIVVKLWASSDARDTDFVARLVDVYPDGFAQNLADGIIRARYRNGDTPELLEPGQVYEFTIDLWATSNLFKTGHRIRLDITSSNFPRWDRNPNTGEAFGNDATTRPANQTILHDAAHPSQVVLPIIPR